MWFRNVLSSLAEVSLYMSVTLPLWAPQNYKYTENKIEVTKKMAHNVSQTFRTGPCQVRTTECCLCVCVCVCVLWEVAGRAPFEGGTWNNVVIEIITVHTKKSALIEADGIGSGSCSSARFFIRVVQKSKWTLVSAAVQKICAMVCPLV